MDLTPKQIVAQLDEYIIGQQKAKRAVAVALRNRYRRSKLTKELREEITPKNILMQGPTGVGKTEIARRLAKLVKAPFVKVEATKFTEVGYVGRDVESMVRDLVEVSVRLVKEEKLQQVQAKAKAAVSAKILETIINTKRNENSEKTTEELKEELAPKLESGELDSMLIEMSVSDSAKPLGMVAGMGPDFDISGMLGTIFPAQKRRKKMSVEKAKELLLQEEADKLIDADNVNSEAIARAEQEGIIFIDEIDKIAGKDRKGPDVSREGVQRDILPLVEGSTVTTKYGIMKTDYILFIAAGAFHMSKIEDLIPEFQGRFPIRVELQNLSQEDFFKILTQPKNALILQYTELLKTENIELNFTKDALQEIARFAEQENETNENLGARRLHTIMELLLEDILFNADGKNADPIKVDIDVEYVNRMFSDARKKYDLKKYVL